MGTENVRNSNGDIKKPETDKGTTSGSKTGASGNRNSRTTKTGASESGTGASGTGAGVGTGASGNRTGTSGSTTRIETEKNSKVSVLSDLPDVNIPTPEEPKKKRKYTKRVKPEEKQQTFNSEQLTGLIVAISSMVASRKGFEHWLISETEAKQIAEPLSNIIEKSNNLKVLGEHADAFALVTACLMIFTPRLIMTLQANKIKKGVKKTNANGNKPNNDRQNNDRQSADSNKQISRKDAPSPANDVSTIFDTISAIQ